MNRNRCFLRNVSGEVLKSVVEAAPLGRLEKGAGFAIMMRGGEAANSSYIDRGNEAIPRFSQTTLNGCVPHLEDPAGKVEKRKERRVMSERYVQSG